MILEFLATHRCKAICMQLGLQDADPLDVNRAPTLLSRIVTLPRREVFRGGDTSETSGYIPYYGDEDTIILDPNEPLMMA